MLRIKKVGSYSIARYPREEFKAYRQPASCAIVRNTTVSAALLVLLQSCEETVGTTGPPPVPPEMVTENEARAVISRVFGDNGIPLVPDVPLSLIDSNEDTVEVVLDGYNESLRVGYEYESDEDGLPVTPELLSSIIENNAGSGPYIAFSTGKEDTLYLEIYMQAFIDTLKAQGKI